MDTVAERLVSHLSGFISPQLLASERYVELDGHLAKIFPLGRIQLGSVVLFEGVLNSGVTSAVFEFLSSGGMQKNWSALVGFENLCFLAAFEKGVDLGKVVSIPDPGRDLAQVVAVLIEAFPIVVIANPEFISSSQARNLISRVRSNKSVMAVARQSLGISGVRTKGSWPASYDYLIRSSMSGFSGLGRGSGFIKERYLSLSLGSKRVGETTKSITVPI
ncbi:MAG: hypothetical protein M0Z96_04735 [Actinomycetota bacterium]|nr:hypothetical protein [Actinomycetota bacterium]